MMKTLTTCLFTATVMLSGPAHASWPGEKPINFVIPYAPGGATDVQTRFLAEKLSKKLNRPVVPMNRPGAGTTIGATYVTQQPADGYTLFMGSITSHGVAPALYKDTVRYDAVKDFSPVILATSIPNVLLVNPKLGIDTVDELIEYARKKPGGLNYASAGYGSTSQMAAALMQQRLGLDMTHVPYTGGAPALTAVVSGDVDIFFDQISTSLPFIKEQRVKALAITADTPSDQAPDIKPMREATTHPAMKDFTIAAWWGVFLRSGTDPKIVAALNRELNDILKENRDYFVSSGVNVGGGTPEQLGELVDQQLAQWRTVVEELKLKPN